MHYNPLTHTTRPSVHSVFNILHQHVAFFNHAQSLTPMSTVFRHCDIPVHLIPYTYDAHVLHKSNFISPSVLNALSVNNIFQAQDLQSPFGADSIVHHGLYHTSKIAPPSLVSDQHMAFIWYCLDHPQLLKALHHHQRYDHGTDMLLFWLFSYHHACIYQKLQTNEQQFNALFCLCYAIKTTQQSFSLGAHFDWFDFLQHVPDRATHCFASTLSNQQRQHLNTFIDTLPL